MAAEVDMDASGGEGWGDDAELQLDEGKFGFQPLVIKKANQNLSFQFADMAT